MILVGQYDSPYVRRVAVSLHTLGLPFTRSTLSAFSNAAELRRVNPIGRVPALILDDGEVLIDSSAILDHLDETAGGGHALLPANGADRRWALRTIAIALGGMDKAVAIVYERYLRPESARHTPWIDRCQAQVAEALHHLETTAAQRPLGLGIHPLAAITTACFIGFLRLRVAEAFPATRYPRLEALSAAAEASPAFIASRPSTDENPPANA